MSTKSSFKERLERPGETKVESRAPSFSPADVQIEMHEGLPAPVSFALLLRDNGLDLREAHAAATRLAAERSVLITLHPGSLRDLLDDLERLGLTAYAVRETRSMRVLVPAALVPPEMRSARDKSISTLHTSLSEKTVGDLRRIHGKGFAQNYRSSAKLSDVLYSMDPVALETIANPNGELRRRSPRRKAEVS